MKYFLAMLLISFNINAAVITHGSLISDSDTNVITDSLNNYEWLRLDVLAPLTYQQTLDVINIQDGGGWNISGYEQANMFVNALLSDTDNTCSLGITNCGNTPTWSDGNFGNNFDRTADYAWYLTDAGQTGYFMIDTNGDVVLRGWSNLAASDAYATSGFFPSLPITWLLYRDVSAVPVPAAVWLFGSGLLGLIGVARRK